MADLIAKICSAEFKNVLNQTNQIVDDFDYVSIQPIDYTGSHKLEDDEWFRIQNFSDQEYFIDECSNDHSTASLTQIANNEYTEISCIGILQGNQKHFQRITPSLFVNRKTWLDHHGEPKIVEQRRQIEIRKESDAIYVADSDTLFFKSIGKIKLIFPGIQDLYRDATQGEIDEFMGYDFIDSTQLTASTVGIMNRKRIADIGTKYKNLPPAKKNQLIAYAKEKAGIDLEGDAFKITSDNDLKNLLYAMDQRYYTADIYGEERIATAFRPAN